MRALIVGTGGVGGFFGVKLARAGHDVSLTARGENLRALRERGLELRSPDGACTVRPAAVLDSVRGSGPVDLVLVCVKAHDTEAAIDGLRAELSATAIVLSLQNGVESEQLIERRLGIPPMLRATAYVGVELVSPGVVRHASGNTLVVGEADDRRSERLARVEETARGAGIDVVVPASIRRAKWQKLAWNASFNLVCALSGAPIGRVMDHHDSRALAIAAMREVEAVAAAEGAAFEPHHVDTMVRLAEDRHRSVRPSTMQDREKGRPLEHDAISGAVVRFGARHGVATPVAATLDALARLVSRPAEAC